MSASARWESGVVPRWWLLFTEGNKPSRRRLSRKAKATNRRLKRRQGKRLVNDC